MSAVCSLEFPLNIDGPKLLPYLRLESAGNRCVYVLQRLCNNLVDRIIWCNWLILIHQNIWKVGILLPPLRHFFLARADLLMPPQMARPVGVFAAHASAAVQALRELNLSIQEDGLVLLPHLGPLLVLVSERCVHPLKCHLHLHAVIVVLLMLVGMLQNLLDYTMLHSCTQFNIQVSNKWI
uniref:Uncharacterized protein n=1 Tax=Arundo donax TaxID=35708 RepID=A0A0A9D316_ARUDO